MNKENEASMLDAITSNGRTKILPEDKKPDKPAIVVYDVFTSKGNATGSRHTYHAAITDITRYIMDNDLTTTDIRKIVIYTV